MRYKKGSRAAKAHMAKLRAMQGHTLRGPGYSGTVKGFAPTRGKGKLVMRGPGYTASRGNPPAYFVIDPTDHEILHVQRASHSMDAAFREAVEQARAFAHILQHEVYVVVHPYVPKEFKKGVKVSPLFYSYGAQVVYPGGRMGPRGNPTARSPWAVCRAAQKKHGFSERKYERCVRKVKGRRNGGSVLIATPSQLEAGKIAGWLRREKVDARVDVHKDQWGVFVPLNQFGRARHALGRVLSKNPLNRRETADTLRSARHDLQAVSKETTKQGRSFLAGRAVGKAWAAKMHGLDREDHTGAEAVFRRGYKVGLKIGNPPRTRKGAEAALDKAIEQAYYRVAREVQVSIMDIPKIFRDVKLELAAGVPIDDAMISVVRHYQQPGGRLINPRSRCNPKSCKNPRHGHRRARRNPLLQMVTLAGNPGRTRPKRAKVWCQMCGEWKGRMHHPVRGSYRTLCSQCYSGARSYARGTGKYLNPPSVPFKHGQVITVQQALDWARKIGNASLIKQCEDAIKLCKEANGEPKKVRIDLLDIGDPKKLDAVVAGVEYGETDETIYKPTKGSKKGRHLYRHEWGEGTGRRKPVPLIAATSGRALVMPLRSGQKAGDWLRG